MADKFVTVESTEELIHAFQINKKNRKPIFLLSLKVIIS